MPIALSGLSDRIEFEHTSSAGSLLWCAAERRSGFCSKSVTGTPRRASWYAHSLPAKPAPTTVTFGIVFAMGFTYVKAQRKPST
jgi:hypothetical protein